MIPAIQKDVGGLLVFDVPEPKAITAASVALYRPDGSELRPEEPASFSDLDRTISTTIRPEEAVEAPLSWYQARWRYTVGGVEQRRPQLFEVRRWVAYCPLTSKKLESYDPVLADRKWPGQEDYGPQIRLAWERDVCGAVRAKGRNPHLVRDVDQLEEPTALFALARIYAGWGPTYQEAAEDQREQATAALQQVFGGLTWYDDDESGVAQGSQQRSFVGIRFTR